MNRHGLDLEFLDISIILDCETLTLLWRKKVDYASLEAFYIVFINIMNILYL
jgi:hypothetical protein